VTVGARSTVTAGAVVVDDVPPDVLVAGTPAEVVRELDDG
jgi:tetrahydrodipicolinate N-acetyltransferase